MPSRPSGTPRRTTAAAPRDDAEEPSTGDDNPSEEDLIAFFIPFQGPICKYLDLFVILNPRFGGPITKNCDIIFLILKSALY